MFVLNPLGRGCIGTCQSQTMPFTVNYDGFIYLHIIQQNVVSIFPIGVLDGDPVIIGPLFPDHGEYTFWFKNASGNRITYINGPSTYDGYTVKILNGFDTVAHGYCDGCEPSPFVLTSEDIAYLQKTLLYFPNDEAALAFGLLQGDWYILSADSDIGVYGTPKVIVL